MSRADGYPELETIDTTYAPQGSASRVWVQRSRTIIRKSKGWALVCFVCDHRWPNHTWKRMVSIRRYRYVFGRWREKAALNVQADDLPKILAALKTADDIPIGTPSAERDVG